MNKKAQGLSINVIIVAIIALLILVIISFIFTGKIALFRKTSEDCASQGGICRQEGFCMEGEATLRQYGCDLNGNGKLNEGVAIDGICCKSI